MRRNTILVIIVLAALLVAFSLDDPSYYEDPARSVDHYEQNNVDPTKKDAVLVGDPDDDMEYFIDKCNELGGVELIPTDHGMVCTWVKQPKPYDIKKVDK